MFSKHAVSGKVLAIYKGVGVQIPRRFIFFKQNSCVHKPYVIGTAEAPEWDVVSMHGMGQAPIM